MSSTMGGPRHACAARRCISACKGQGGSRFMLRAGSGPFMVCAPVGRARPNQLKGSPFMVCAPVGRARPNQLRGSPFMVCAPVGRARPNQLRGSPFMVCAQKGRAPGCHRSGPQA